MSAVKLIPASGGGSVSLAPPNSTSGSDITITMPSTSQTLSGGKILQVVSTTKADSASTTSTSYVDTGLSQAITPSSSSSKILVLCDFFGSTTTNTALYLNIVRGSTNISQGTSGDTENATKTLFTEGWMFSNAIHYLDSPSTTSATTYKIQWKVQAGSIMMNRWYGNTYYGATSSLTLMEVAG